MATKLSDIMAQLPPLYCVKVEIFKFLSWEGLLKPTFRTLNCHRSKKQS